LLRTTTTEVHLTLPTDFQHTCTFPFDERWPRRSPCDALILPTSCILHQHTHTHTRARAHTHTHTRTHTQPHADYDGGDKHLALQRGDTFVMKPGKKDAARFSEEQNEMRTHVLAILKKFGAREVSDSDVFVAPLLIVGAPVTLLLILLLLQLKSAHCSGSG
jgi:hypothetical protein